MRWDLWWRWHLFDFYPAKNKIAFMRRMLVDCDFQFLASGVLQESQRAVLSLHLAVVISVRLVSGSVSGATILVYM